MPKKFYITAAIPYVNAEPHIGHALEFIQTDCIARYHRLLGENVICLSGGDENSLKNVQAAEKLGKPIQELVNKNTFLFYKLTQELNCQFDIWQKSSDPKHYYSTQKLWELCAKNGDIYKKKYTGLYCVGCEAFYSSEELNEKGECYEHPGLKLEKVAEENYFFNLSKYQKKLFQLIKNDEIEIIPESRKNEILSFIRKGLHDLSISRSNKRAKNWGVPVPKDPTQRIYVWFDALNVYQSGIGFGWNEQMYKRWWPADIHVIGKGILRFHAIYWPAFLLSAGLKLPRKIFVHGYLTVDKQKISKTVGNIINPVRIIKNYGAEALRYYLLAKFSPFDDGDFSENHFKEIYNSDLANGLGNLVSRIAKLAEAKNISAKDIKVRKYSPRNSNYQIYLEKFEFNLALETIWKEIKKLDIDINRERAWESNSGEETKNYISRLLKIAYDLRPFLPETSNKIQKQFNKNKIRLEKPLFPRLN